MAETAFDAKQYDQKMTELCAPAVAAQGPERGVWAVRRSLEARLVLCGPPWSLGRECRVAGWGRWAC